MCIDDNRPAIAAIEEGEDEKDGPESPLHKGPKPQVAYIEMDNVYMCIDINAWRLFTYIIYMGEVVIAYHHKVGQGCDISLQMNDATIVFPSSVVCMCVYASIYATLFDPFCVA